MKFCIESDVLSRVHKVYFKTKMYKDIISFPLSIYRNFPKFSDRQVWANSADPDQTAPREEQSDQGLHCLPFPLHLLDALH